MNNYKVYKHTFPNGKVYIGITQQSLTRRWQNGKGYYKNTYISKAIQKYGWDNIKHEVLCCDLTKEQAEKKEVELIALYKSNNSNFGYNISSGGNSVGKHSAETIQKMRESKLGEKNAMYGKHLSPENKIKFLSYANNNTGKHLSDETKQKLRDKLKNRIISEETRRKMSASRMGRVVSEETRRKISNSRKGIQFSETHKQRLLEKNRQRCCRAIFCVETGVTYDSVVDAARKTKVKNPSNITRAAKCGAVAYGYHWEFCV